MEFCNFMTDLSTDIHVYVNPLHCFPAILAIMFLSNKLFELPFCAVNSYQLLWAKFTFN